MTFYYQLPASFWTEANLRLNINLCAELDSAHEAWYATFLAEEDLANNHGYQETHTPAQPPSTYPPPRTLDINDVLAVQARQDAERVARGSPELPSSSFAAAAPAGNSGVVGGSEVLEPARQVLEGFGEVEEEASTPFVFYYSDSEDETVGEGTGAAGERKEEAGEDQEGGYEDEDVGVEVEAAEEEEEKEVEDEDEEEADDDEEDEDYAPTRPRRPSTHHPSAIPTTTPTTNPPTNPPTNPATTTPNKPTTWSTAEDHACITLMREICTNAPSSISHSEQRFSECSRRLASEHGFVRSAAGVKLQWNRRLRALSGYEDRVKKQRGSGLTTSSLGGGARVGRRVVAGDDEGDDEEDDEEEEAEEAEAEQHEEVAAAPAPAPAATTQDHAYYALSTSNLIHGPRTRGKKRPLPADDADSSSDEPESRRKRVKQGKRARVEGDEEAGQGGLGQAQGEGECEDDEDEEMEGSDEEGGEQLGREADQIAADEELARVLQAELNGGSGAGASRRRGGVRMKKW